MGAIRVFQNMKQEKPAWEVELATDNEFGRAISLYVDGPSHAPDRDYDSGTLKVNSATFDFSSGTGILVDCDIEIAYEFYRGYLDCKDLIGRYKSLEDFASDVVDITRGEIGWDIDEADAYKKLIQTLDQEYTFWND